MIARPQIFYTEEDKPIMEAAWEFTAAHRESMSGHTGPPAVLDRPGQSDGLVTEGARVNENMCTVLRILLWCVFCSYGIENGYRM